MEVNKIMNKKIPRFIILILIISFICVGCSDDTKNKTAKTDENVLHCKRKATTTDGASTSLTYSIYYDGDYVTKTVSVEKVTSDDDAILKKYQTAYENVFSPYKNIDYYDNKVTTTSNSVISTTVIDYNKVDINKIIAIEGSDDNIFESDGKVKKETLTTFFSLPFFPTASIISAFYSLVKSLL